MEDRREAVDIIRRFLKCEVEEETLLGFLTKLDIGSACRLPEALDLGTEEFRAIGFREEDLVRLLERFLVGRLPREPLWARIRRSAQIFSSSEYRCASVCRPQLVEALNLLRLVLDPQAPVDAGRLPVYLAPVLVALGERKPVPFRQVLERVLGDLEAYHFANLSSADLGGQNGRLSFTDLALLYERPSAPPSRGVCEPRALDDVWFIPLSVTTRRFLREGLLREGALCEPPQPDGLPRTAGGDASDPDWMHPENCRLASLRERHPYLAADGSRAAYLVDPRGFSEVVLDRPHLTREDLAFAIQVFAIENGARAASLDGELLALYSRPV